MIFFWILWGIDSIVAAVVLYFFFVGLGDGTVTLRNGMLWFIILLVLAAIVCGSLFLKSYDHLTLAKWLLAIIAVPAFLFGLYMFIAIVTGAKWN